MARLETRAGGRERGWKAEANSPSFYPILESECLAPLTLETGCTAGSYTHHHRIFLSTPASFATTTTASSFSTDYNPLPSLLTRLFLRHRFLVLRPRFTLFQPSALSCQPFSRDHRLTRNVSSWPDWDSFEISRRDTTAILSSKPSFTSKPLPSLSICKFFLPRCCLPEVGEGEREEKVASCGVCY